MSLVPICESMLSCTDFTFVQPSFYFGCMQSILSGLAILFQLYNCLTFVDSASNHSSGSSSQRRNVWPLQMPVMTASLGPTDFLLCPKCSFPSPPAALDWMAAPLGHSYALPLCHSIGARCSFDCSLRSSAICLLRRSSSWRRPRSACSACIVNDM